MKPGIYKGVMLKTAKLLHNKSSGQPIILIKFPFDRETLEQIRTISGRKYNPTERYWTCPVNMDNIESLKSFGFRLDEDLKKKLNSKINIESIYPIEIPGLPYALKPFQKIGVGFFEHKNGRALCADEMGLGKTIQTLSWLFLHSEKRPVIIVCPSSLKLNWSWEAQKWLINPFVQILNGEKSNINLLGKILIINYDIISHWIEKLKMIKPQVLILDECHYIKNDKAKRTKSIKQLVKGIPHIIALSGTPITNRPIEIYNAVNIIDNTLFPNRWAFLHRYCGAKYNGFGWDFNGATNIEELHKKLTESIMIRRKKQDVLKELPDKTYSFVPIELENEKEYQAAESNFIQYLQQTKGVEVAKRALNGGILTEIEILKQVAVKNKMKQAISWIHDFLESGLKLVVFAHHKFIIDQLMNEFQTIAVKIDGGVSNENRQKAVEEFQTNPNIRLFVGNIKAAGVGITLTASSNVVFLELPWTPGELSQAEDRCHRIGQEDKVNIYSLLALNTIEISIARLLDEKRKVLDGVLDGIETQTESLLTTLINNYYENTLFN